MRLRTGSGGLAMRLTEGPADGLYPFPDHAAQRGGLGRLGIQIEGPYCVSLFKTAECPVSALDPGRINPCL